MRLPARLCFSCVAAGSFLGLTHAARPLSFEERVSAQQAVQRVYYVHQQGATQQFREAVPEDVLESKVRLSLQQTAALETIWQTEVTEEMLARELSRMIRDTRMPGRLREIFAALDDDPQLIMECLARASLVDRLSRSFYAFDATLHRQARVLAEELHRALDSGHLDPRQEHALRSVVLVQGEQQRARLPNKSRPRPTPTEELDNGFSIRVPLADRQDGTEFATYFVAKKSWDEWWATARRNLSAAEVPVAAAEANDDRAAGEVTRARAALLNFVRSFDSAAPSQSHYGCDDHDTWDNATFGNDAPRRTDQSNVWTGSEMIVWGGKADVGWSIYGGRYDPATDTWTPTSTVNAPQERDLHTAVWTGSEMIVFGGDIGPECTATGAKYNPTTDTWVATALAGAPAGRCRHTAIWDGTRMIVWGGGVVRSISSPTLNSGGIYDPATNSWTATSLTNAPAGRLYHTAVWTGTKMVVWGGYDSMVTGGMYDPSSNTWTATSTASAPQGRARHSAVWTGSQMIVWGGEGSSVALGTGGRFDPALNVWLGATSPGPAVRVDHAAVWTGTEMIVWGGANISGAGMMNTGGRYNPATNSWVATPTEGAPLLSRHTAVWTGSQMIVWGPGHTAQRGARYAPASNSWTPVGPYAPHSRYGHQAVWTGTHKVVWGGETDDPYFRLTSGGRYDPALDTWTATSEIGAPSPRVDESMVWTGTEVIVWGGFTESTRQNTGGRYDPLTDSWTSTSTIGARPRNLHTAVWTGTHMIVWGGDTNQGPNTFAERYDPTSDTWAPIATTNAPASRSGHTAVWTGSEMLIWGGFAVGQPSPVPGGRYNPVTNTWVQMSTVGAPASVSGAKGVWTGHYLFVWGLDSTNGGRYDPVLDVWKPMAAAGAPTPRASFSMIWTGREAVVWGGLSSSSDLNTGARYDPELDAWTPVSLTGAPPARRLHSAVWTGESMLVWGGEKLFSPPYGTGGRYVLVPIQPETCDGADNDCNGSVDDGIAVPSAIPALTESKSGVDAVLNWSSVSGATGYDVVTGSLAALHGSDGDFATSAADCVADDLALTTATAGGVPDAGEAFWYLVRPTNACSGPGSYDTPSAAQVETRDDELAASAMACP